MALAKNEAKRIKNKHSDIYQNYKSEDYYIIILLHHYCILFLLSL